MAEQRHADEGIVMQGIGAGATIKRRGILAAAGAVVAGLVASTVVGATPSAGQAGSDDRNWSSTTLTPNFAPPAADTLYATMDGSDFAPSDSVETYAYSGQGAIHATSHPAFAFFGTLLDLPQGAAISELVFSLIHNNSGAIELALFAFDANGATLNLGSVSFFAFSASIVTVAVPLGSVVVVDNSRFTYVAMWTPANSDSTDVLYGARVGYTLPGNAQVYGNAQAGVGVRGDSASGNGVIGNASGAGTVAGVLGSTSATLFTDQRAGVAGMSNVAAVPAIFGHATVGDTNGVTGSGANKGAGVFGINSNAVGIGVQGFNDFGPAVQGNTSVGKGVAGLATGANGIGVIGQSASGTGVYGIIPGGSAAGTIAISGSNNATAANSHGIVGVATVGHGLVGTTNYTPPPGGGPPYYAGLVGFGPNGANAGNFYGNVAITGTLNGHGAVIAHAQVAVAHPDGAHRLAQPVVSPEGWMEDFGDGTLANGQAEVKIDPAFAALADMGKYHVFLTAHGDYNLHVAEMKADGFVVRATSLGSGGQPTGGGVAPGSQVAKVSNVAGTFTWRVTVKRKDGQVQRLATYTFPHLEPPHIPDTPKQP